MKISKKNTILTATLLLSQLSNAATLSFTNFDATNGLQVDGSNTGLTVVSSTVGGNNLNYAVTYTGTVDSVNTTIFFNLLVEGLAAGTVSTSSVTPGITDNDVTLSTQAGNLGAWTVTDPAITDPIINQRFGDGESLRFTISDLTSSVGSADLTGFTGFSIDEFGGNSHEAIVGTDSGASALQVFTTGGNAAFTIDQTGPLYISSASVTSGTGQGASSWAVTDLDFNIDVDVTQVPEPSSTALLGIAGLAGILRRRK